MPLMKRLLDRLSYHEILKIYDKYVELRSLEATVAWVRTQFDWPVNRHDLSRKFKSLGLNVRPPNGHEAVYWRDTSEYASPYAKLASDIVRLAVDDYFAYLNGTGAKIDFMSACVFMLGDMWETCVMILLQGSNLTLKPNTLPLGVDSNKVMEGADLYNRGYYYWVVGIG